MAAAQTARQVYGMETPPYMPHLSLLYRYFVKKGVKTFWGLCLGAAGLQPVFLRVLQPVFLWVLQPNHLLCTFSFRSDIPQDERDKAAAVAHKRLYGEGSGWDTLLCQPGFVADSLAVYYTPTEDKELKSWVKIADVPLSG